MKTFFDRVCQRVPRWGIIAVLVCAIGSSREGILAQGSLPRPSSASSDTVFARITAENSRLKSQLDSLQDDLSKHRYAENFYDAALEDQANRFSLIIGSLLVIIGGITFAGFRQEVRRLEQELRAAIKFQEAKANDVERRVAEMEIFTRRMAGNTYAALAGVYESQQKYLLAVVPRLLAAGNFYASYTAIPANDRTQRRRNAAVGNLKRGLKVIRALESVDRARVTRHFALERERLEEAFTLLRRYADPDAEIVLAEIRVALHSYLSDRKDTTGQAAASSP
jgi:hypothetical protein